MTDPGLLQTILEDPFDDRSRLAYAAECEREDPARAQFIRLQVERRRGGPPARPVRPEAQRRPDPLDPQVQFLGDVGAVRAAVETKRDEDRERKLLAEHGERWAGALGRRATGYRFDRGFLSALTLPAEAFLELEPEALRAAPILQLKLEGVAPLAEAVFTSPLLAGLPALDLAYNDLGTAEIVHLASSPFVKRLWWLELAGNRLDFGGVKLLASSRCLLRLAYVGLSGNPSNPMETIGVEGDTILDASLPEDGERLEALYGHVSWIHYPGDSARDWPPEALGPPPTTA